MSYISSPIYLHGQSDGGLGVWASRHTPEKGAAYQIEVTGAPRHTEYVVKTDLMKSGEIKFDGFNPERGVLIDAKDFNKWPKDEAWSLDVVLRDARKQSAVASQVKTKVEWHIPNQEKFELVSQLLRENKVKNIKPVYTPKGG